jgi:ABC-2 type transport system ATP-binding protein
MNQMYDEIVAFAELERFMDQKLKNYSSGMQVRLAFSIAIRANTDILVLDEVLAVGDANFQKKCFEVFNQIKREGRTVVFISHDMSAVKRYCDRAILLNNSVLQTEGTTDTIISEYMEINKLSAVKELARFNTKQSKNRSKNSTKTVHISEIGTYNAKKEPTVIFKPLEKIVISCELNAKQVVEGAEVIIKVNNPGGPAVFAMSTKVKKMNVKLTPGSRSVITWEVENIFNNGTYIVSVQVFDNDGTTIHDEQIDALRFEVSGWVSTQSIVHPEDKVTIKYL